MGLLSRLLLFHFDHIVQTMNVSLIKSLGIASLSLLASLAPVALTSCSDDDNDSVSIAAAQTQFPCTGGETTLTVFANASWTVSGVPTWLSLDKTYGNGDATIAATILANPSTASRSVTLSIRCGDASDTLRISQDPSVPQANVNANDATLFGAVSLRTEMPRFNAENTFVTHYAKLNGVTDVNFSLEWNNDLKHSAWVAYTLDKYSSQMNVTRASSDAFKPDPELPTEMQVTNYNHTNDGLDRGHICASGDRLYSTEMNEQTFYFSNMSPMLNGFNAGIWRRMEDEVRKWGSATQSAKYDTIFVCKGGDINNLLTNFTSSTPGSDGKYATTDANGMTIKGLACPAFYFMAILAVKDGDYSAVAFYVPHDDQITPLDGSSDFTVADIKKYVVTVDELESKTGLDFFCNLPDETEAQVESVTGPFWD